MKHLAVDETIARLNKPKSMRYIRQVAKPIFEEAKAKFGNAIVEIVEREHWGQNFDAYYDVWIRSRSSRIEKFFDDKFFNLQLEQGVAVLAQIKETDDYRERSRINVAVNSKKHSKNGKLAGLRM
jgi:hypothetical protein